MRGDGDLTPTLPWLAAYSDWLDARVRRNAALTKFYYEVTVDNAEDARRRAALPLPPADGTVVVHSAAEHHNVAAHQRRRRQGRWLCCAP